MKSVAVALSMTIALSQSWAALAQERASGVDPAPGEAIYADACAQCHGRTGRGMASFPSLQSLDAETFVSRLESYRAGETIGPNSALMKPVAADLSDEEIADLAAFMSQHFR